MNAPKGCIAEYQEKVKAIRQEFVDNVPGSEWEDTGMRDIPLSAIEFQRDALLDIITARDLITAYGYSDKIMIRYMIGVADAARKELEKWL